MCKSDVTDEAGDAGVFADQHSAAKRWFHPHKLGTLESLLPLLLERSYLIVATLCEESGV